MRKVLIVILSLTLLSSVAWGKMTQISTTSEGHVIEISSSTGDNYSASYIEMGILICLGLFMKNI